MWKKLAGYSLLFLSSFSLTAIFLFGNSAYAQLATIKPIPVPSLTQTPKPTPTLLPTDIPEPTLIPTSTPTPIPPTNTPTPIPTIISPGNLDSLFDKYANEHHIDKELLKKIAKCESGFNQEASNGPYLGMFQFTEQTWISTRTAMGQDSNPDLRKNTEESIKTAAYKLSQGASSAWSGCL